MATLHDMPVYIASRPDWATIMTAFGTVAAVIAAAWIAIASSRKTTKLVAKERIEADRRLNRQLEHSDEQLRQQHEEADKRLLEQFVRTDELEQRSEAAAVEVIGYRLKSGVRDLPESQNPSGRPAVLVINKGKYAITNLAVRLSPDGRSIIELWRSKNLVDLSAVPNHWTEDVTGLLGDVYGGTIAPGGAMRFEGEEMAGDVLRTAFAIVRWNDRWEATWEHRKGQVYQTHMQADWISPAPDRGTAMYGTTA